MKSKNNNYQFEDEFLFIQLAELMPTSPLGPSRCGAARRRAAAPGSTACGISGAREEGRCAINGTYDGLEEPPAFELVCGDLSHWRRCPRVASGGRSRHAGRQMCRRGQFDAG